MYFCLFMYIYILFIVFKIKMKKLNFNIIMVVFILFNSDGHSIDQWKKNPYDESIKSNLLTKLKKLGEVYLYNPIFFNFNQFNTLITNAKYSKEYIFNIDALNLDYHCGKLFEDVYKIDQQFILICHKSSFMMAHVFASKYEENVYGIINIDGGMSKDWIKKWLDNEKIESIKKIKQKELDILFKNFSENNNVDETINLLNFVIKYHIYKQYYKLYSDDNIFDFPIIIFTNINPQNNLETLDKFKFLNEMTKNNNDVKSFLYLKKSNFLYFDIEKDIIDNIKIIIDSIDSTKIIEYD